MMAPNNSLAIAIAARRETIYELLKHLKFACPGAPRSCICDVCGADQYCTELRSVTA